MARAERNERLSLGAKYYLGALYLRVFTVLIGVTTLAASLDHRKILCPDKDASLCMVAQWMAATMVRTSKEGTHFMTFVYIG